MSDAKRVQGTASDIGDLTLRSGKKLKQVAIEVGGGITPTPELVRTTEGASTLTVPIYDPNLSFLRHSLLSEKFDAELDGLHFRYVGLSKTGKNLGLTLEDRDVAKIREFLGPRRAFARRGQKDELTRAEFVKSLVREAHPSLDFFCPQLHKKQPIEKKSQGTKAKDESKANRGKGIGETKGLTVNGHAADSAQIALGDDALRIAESVHAPSQVTLALIESLIVETEMGTLDPGNPLQATPASKSGSNESDINRFLTGGWGVDPTGNGAIGYYRANPGKSPGEIAQAIQGSRYPERYDGVSKEAREWFEAYEGGEGSASAEVTEPYVFKVGKDETYWAAIQRLAKEVNWRAFIVAGRFFFIDEIELSRGEVRLAINQATETEQGIEDVDFEYDAGMPITEVTVTARVKKWGVPPGAVVTIEGYGPASFGSGDAPPKNKKAPRVASAVKAATHEGKGRYLVTAIETPVGGNAESRLATITLKRPTKPLPEPANKTTTTSSGESPAGAGGDAAVQRVLKFCEGEIGKPYVWGSFGPNGYDCSGFVSKALTVGGFASGHLTTVTLASWGEPGEGEFITVHDKNGTGDAHTEHVLIEVLGIVFECGGISGGVGKPNYSPSELAAFSTKRHPKGE